MTNNNSIENSSIGIVGNKIDIKNLNQTTETEDYLYEFEITSPPIDTFKGRENDIKNLVDSFFKDKKRNIVIYGLPGYGKSELARQFANICTTQENKQIDRAFWIICQEKDNKQKERLLRKAYDKCKNERCLYIYDDCSKYVRKIQPPDNNNYFLLATSQHGEWKQKNLYSVKLEPLSLDSAIEVFQSILTEEYYDTNEDDLYKDLACIVDNVPLGLQVIGGNLKHDRVNNFYMGEVFKLEDYVERLKQCQEIIIDQRIDNSMDNTYNKSIYVAMQVLLQKIGEEISDEVLKNLTLNILYICSYLNPQFIYFKELVQIPNIKNKWDKYKSIKKMMTMIPVHVLINFSFIKFISPDRPVLIQKLTQMFLRYHLNLSENKLLKSETYMSCLQYVFEEITDVKHNETHIESVLKYAKENVSIVHTFYKNHVNNKKISENILENLIKYACVECIKKIVKNFNKSEKLEYIYSKKLSDLARKYKKVDMFHFLISNNKIKCEML